MTTLAKKRVNPFKSTNFTLQGVVAFIMPALLAIAAAFDVPEELTNQIVEFLVGAIATGVALWGGLREALKGAKFRINSNVITYVVTFAAGIWTFLDAYREQLTDAFVGLWEALASGNWAIILPSIFPLVNIIYNIIRDRRNQPDQPASG